MESTPDVVLGKRSLREYVPDFSARKTHSSVEKTDWKRVGAVGETCFQSRVYAQVR